MEDLKSFWKGLTPQGRVVIISVVMSLSFILYKKYYWKIRKFFTKREVDDNLSDYLAVTDRRKGELEYLAGRSKERLDTYTSLWYNLVGNDAILYEINSLTDVELLYFSEYYNKVIGRDLRQDIDALWMPYEDIDDLIYDKLVRLAI
jgi:hypothetical protein